MLLILILIGVAMPDASGPDRQGVSIAKGAALVGLYEAAMDDINALAGRAIVELAEDPDRRASQFRLSRSAELTTQVQRRLAELGRDAFPLVSQAARDAVRLGIAQGRSQLSEIGLDPEATLAQTTGAGFAGSNATAIDAIAEDIVAAEQQQMRSELARAAAEQGQQALRVFRQLSESPALAGPAGSTESSVNRAIGRALISGNPSLADRAIRDLFRDPDAPEREGVRKLGNKIISVGRADMTVRAYAALVTRTRTREATVVGRHRRLQASGIQLVSITGRTSENFCTAYLGLVCSLDGERTINGVTYPALDSLPGGGPPFHPNCSKGTAAFAPELSSSSRIERHVKASREYRSRQRTGRLTAPVR